MKLQFFARLAGALALTVGLAGCMDMTAEIDVKSETAGTATTTITIAKEFYPMIKQMTEAAKAAPKDPSAAPASPTDNFCNAAGDQLTENADGSGTCVSVKEGDLASLSGTEGPSQDATYTVVSPGVVKVSFKTDSMSSQASEGQDEQTKAMMQTYFAGHNATIRIKGKKITDTNMTLSADGTAAEVVIPFTELMDGTTKLPAELYAVVDTN